MKEKGTKNFLETGRTFATIFADIELRAKLLKAATQEEFISIIDVSEAFPLLSMIPWVLPVD